MQIEIVDAELPATLQDLEAFERELGVRLPEPYRTHVLRINGGSPEPGTFAYELPSGRKKRSTVAWFLNFGDHEHENSTRYLKTFRHRIPADTAPIARDPGGSLILIGIESENRGRIFFWDRRNEVEEGEQATYDNVYQIAETFDAFLDSLEPA